MWILIILMTFSTYGKGGVTSTSVPGFETQKACQEAAMATIRNRLRDTEIAAFCVKQ